MKETWQQVVDKINDLSQTYEELSGVLPAGQTIIKKQRRFEKSYNNLCKAVNAMDKFIAPVEAIKVNSPFNHKKFKETWEFWKEYLIEQHGIHLRSRSELMAIKHMNEITDGDPDLAIHYLQYAMANRYANFFVVDQGKDALQRVSDPSSVTIPDRYKSKDALQRVSNNNKNT